MKPALRIYLFASIGMWVFLAVWLEFGGGKMPVKVLSTVTVVLLTVLFLWRGFSSPAQK